MVLRPATDADVPACADILSRWTRETPWYPRARGPAFARDLVAEKLACHEVTVAMSPALSAFLVREEAYISCLYVASGHRGCGIGRALLDLAKARADRLTLWTHQANGRARAFYLREGFRPGRRTAGDNAEALPDIEFVWMREGTQ